MYFSLSLATVLVALTSRVSAQSLTYTSVNDAQASALAGPLSSYIRQVEASPSFVQVVAEIAKATAHPDAALGNGAPAAGDFPAFAAELNAVAAQDPSEVAGIPAEAQAFLAQAAKGEIEVINSVLGGQQKEQQASSAGGTKIAGTVTGTASHKPLATSVLLIPTGYSAANMSSPNATMATHAPTQSAGPQQHVASGAAPITTVGASMLAFMAALWAALA